MPLIPKLIGLSSAHATDSGQPLTPIDALLLVDAVIGPQTSSGEPVWGDNFSFYMTTIDHISRAVEEIGWFSCPYLIIVREYGWVEFEKAITQLLTLDDFQGCETWGELANVLSRYGDWGFRGVRSSQP